MKLIDKNGKSAEFELRIRHADGELEPDCFAEIASNVYLPNAQIEFTLAEEIDGWRQGVAMANGEATACDYTAFVFFVALAFTDEEKAKGYKWVLTVTEEN